MSIKKKSKRDRSPDSSYLPNQPSAKKLRADDGQEKISAALNKFMAFNKFSHVKTYV